MTVLVQLPRFCMQKNRRHYCKKSVINAHLHAREPKTPARFAQAFLGPRSEPVASVTAGVQVSADKQDEEKLVAKQKEKGMGVIAVQGHCSRLISTKLHDAAGFG